MSIRIAKSLKPVLLLIGFLLLLAEFIFIPPTESNQNPAQTPAAPTINPNSVKVTRAVDGDTIRVEINGKSETVRLIGVDTPETVDPRKPVQCFGKEASAKTKELVEGKNVIMDADPSQSDRNSFGRLLRYIRLEDGTFVNQKLIEDGYAFEYTYNIPYKYQTEFKEAEKQAEANKRGLWADNACPVTPTDTASKTIF